MFSLVGSSLRDRKQLLDFFSWFSLHKFFSVVFALQDYFVY